MSRIVECFSSLQSSGRKGLITFITAGDPTPEATPTYMHALVKGGADIIELGVPFSDPMADGPVIQRSSERALAAGTTPDEVLRCVARFRQQDKRTPVVLMGYLNPFEHMDAFAERAIEAGVDGVLVVDLPPEEASEFNGRLSAAGLAQVFLVAPNSSSERIATICAYASGFVYFVGVKGVTGGKALDVAGIQARIGETRSVSRLPVGIGFGIRTPEAAAEAAAIADAVVVGSTLVDIIESGIGNAAIVTTTALERTVAALRNAIDARADAA